MHVMISTKFLSYSENLEMFFISMRLLQYDRKGPFFVSAIEILDGLTNLKVLCVWMYCLVANINT